MILTYDGLSNPNNIITLTGIPNILTLESDNVQGSKAELRITVDNLQNIELGKEYFININDQIITSTNGKAYNKQFYITNANSSLDKIAVASSIARALRNASLVNYEIYQENNNGVLTNVVIIQSREVGDQYELKMNSNMGNALKTSNYPGSTSDEFVGYKICIDIYSDRDYITTLEKSYYKERIDFNLSQVLTSISRYDFLTPYTLNIYADNGTRVKSLGIFTNMKSAIGYMVNQGQKYLNSGLAQNVSRGTLEGTFNKMELYTYFASIPISVYADSANITLEIDYLDSSKESIRQTSVNMPLYGGYGYLDIPLEQEFFNNSNYIDITIPDVGVVRYTVIKPLNATGRGQRVYYHNSYGGVSFFDFTGEIKEDHKVDNETYTRNIFDYYESNSMEQLKIYNKTSTINVTMKSHLMTRDAVWQFNDLLGSYDAWTNINGVDYKIIITDCKVDETDTGVWQATITYTYSLI